MEWYFYFLIAVVVIAFAAMAFAIFAVGKERKKTKAAKQGDATAEGEICACNLFVYKGRRSYTTFVKVPGVAQPLKVRYTENQVKRAKQGSPIGERVTVKYSSKNPQYCQIVE